MSIKPATEKEIPFSSQRHKVCVLLVAITLSLSLSLSLINMNIA